MALDAVGLAQAERAAQLLAALPPTYLVSSDLLRARATMGELAQLTGLPVALDARLRETHGGRWQGLLPDEIAALDPADYVAWRAGKDVAAGGSETRGQVADRAVAALEDALAAAGPDAVVVAASHGGTVRAALGRLLGLPLPAWARLGGLSNCSWSVLTEEHGGWTLTEHNAGTLPLPVLGGDNS